MAAPSKLTDEQWEQVRKWESEGRPRPETARLIQQHYGVSITRKALGNRLGRRNAVLGRDKDARIFKTYLTDEQIEALRSIACGFGLRDGAPEGNVSSLMRGIADKQYEVRRVSPGALR
jgi:hypothetical protein